MTSGQTGCRKIHRKDNEKWEKEGCCRKKKRNVILPADRNK